MTDKTFEKYKLVVDEIYKDIPQFKGVYQASNLGNIKRLGFKSWMSRNNCFKNNKEIVMSTNKDRKGYLRVTLNDKGKSKNYKVHQLIAMAFLGHVPCGYEKVVDHIDNNPLNNRSENLQIITARENVSKDRINSTSDYTGVWWNKSNKKWQAGIRINNNLNHLGYFNCENKAAVAYRLALSNI